MALLTIVEKEGPEKHQDHQPVLSCPKATHLECKSYVLG